MVWKNYTKTRNRTSITFNTLDKISLTVVNNNYFCGHYNPSDFSLMSDFYVLKSDLNIVNKSFVTLGEPLKFDRYHEYIRVCFY
jgi:hypothetical protein